MQAEVGARRDLVAFLQSIARPGFDLAQVADDANLVDGGMLDSLALVMVIQYLEDAHHIDFSEAKLDPAQLTSIGEILRIIAAARP
jgi:acyl carrier protein